ncbi:MAG TPA: sigma-70 family RNA polymerase sigma factor [Acidimicrobiales bacterium]|nr:sigma-70 family RNA polymerase sigma factor [Acidimicrobiales bacterium]
MSPRPATAAVDDLSDELLVARAQRGDDPAQRALIQRYRRFASSKGRRFHIVGGDEDDIVQEALIGLYKAVRDYRSDGPASFRTFAELCITRQIMTAVKTARRRKHQPLNQYVSIFRAGDEEPRGSFVEQLLDDRQGADPAEGIAADDGARALDEAVAAMLSAFEVEVLHLLVEGRSHKEIGARLGRDPKAVDNALQRIKRKAGSASLEASA